MKLRIALALAIGLPAAACVRFGAEPPPSLLTLTPASAPAAGQARTVDPARTVQIAVPLVPAALANVRVPVRASDTSVAYLKDAQWSEPPNRLFRSLLADTIEARTGRPVLDQRTFTITAGVRLSGTLKAFGVDAPGNAVVVTYDAMLARGDAPAQERRFEARVPVGATDVASVAPALNQAANQVATEVADWIGQ